MSLASFRITKHSAVAESEPLPAAVCLALWIATSGGIWALILSFL